MILRDQLDPHEKFIKDTSICKKLMSLTFSVQPRIVHVYIPMKSEPDIWDFIEFLLQNNIKVVAPKTLKNRMLEHYYLENKNALVKGTFGTLHPLENIQFEGLADLVIVPGLAFDENGNRVGYGGGYYDAFLKSQSAALKVGVCYDFQLLKNLPKEEHDVPVNSVIYS